MNLDWINTPVGRRTLFWFAWRWLMALAAQSILWSPLSHIHQSGIPWEFERDVGNVVVSGNYDWACHGDADSLIEALRQLRTHFQNGTGPSLGVALDSIKRTWWVNYGSETLEPMTQFVTCSDADFHAFEIGIKREAQEIKQKRSAQVQEKISSILARHPLQYVTSDAIGLTLGVECEEPGDLLQILWQKIAHGFSPSRPNTQNHRIGFLWTVKKIHCILSGKIVG